MNARARFAHRGVLRATLIVCALFAQARTASAETLKFSTWNLNWLTIRSHAEAHLPTDVHARAPEDFERLAGYAAKLNADVVAFQEVDGPDSASRIFDPARYTILTIDEPVTQRVGLAIRRDIPASRNPDYTPLDVEPTARFPLRDGLDATLTLPGNRKLRILVMHLKTGCQTDRLATSHRVQCALFARQIAPLAAWVAARAREGAAFLLMGDFNRVLDEPEELGAALAEAAPLTRVTAGRADLAGTAARSSTTSSPAARPGPGCGPTACGFKSSTRSASAGVSISRTTAPLVCSSIRAKHRRPERQLTLFRPRVDTLKRDCLDAPSRRNRREQGWIRL